MTDQELIQQFVTRRSESAFRQLVERHTDWVYSVCLRRLRDRSLAEDATQAVFVALAQRAPSLAGERTISPWLHQVAKFVAANILRARERRARHEAEAAAMKPTSSPPALEWHAIEVELEPALDQLSLRDRETILLRFYEQKSNLEIARALRISEAAAAKRVERALDRLRILLASKSGTAFSTAALAPLLLSHTVISAPHALAASAAASTTAASVAKGALMAMTVAKVQTAAILAAACLLILIPVTVITLRRAPSGPTPPPALSVPAAAPDINDPLAYYSLQPNEAFKLVTDAPLAARTAFLADGDLTRKPPPDGKYITVRWKNEQPYLWGYGDAVPLGDLLEVYMGVFPQTLNFNVPLPANMEREFFNWHHTVALPMLKGDFVVREGAKPEQYRAALEPILTKSLDQPVKIAFRDVAEKVIVLRGTWDYTPHEPRARASVPGMQVVEIYGPAIDRRLDQGILANGDKYYFAGHLGAWIEEPVTVEVENFPTAVAAHFNNESFNDPQIHDKTLVMNHVAEQTGLTWSEETRTVRHLFIEPAAPSPPRDAFAQIYGLAPGELVKRITDAPPEVRDPFIREHFNSDQATRATLFIGWTGDTMCGYGFYGARRYSVSMLASQILSLESLEIGGDLAKRSVAGGDFSYSQDNSTSPDQLCAALQTILQDELQVPVTLQFRNVPRKIIVLRGKWKFTPNPDIPDTNSPTGPFGLPIPCVDIYGGDHFDKGSMQSGSGSGGARTLAGNLASWIHQQVFIEATGSPLTFGYRLHESRSNDPEASALAHDRDSVLKHITEQTGLTWTEETRTVRRLFIESSK